MNEFVFAFSNGFDRMMVVAPTFEEARLIAFNQAATVEPLIHIPFSYIDWGDIMSYPNGTPEVRH